MARGWCPVTIMIAWADSPRSMACIARSTLFQKPSQPPPFLALQTQAAARIPFLF
jgi:hypothetical protein